jgi:hypothetical protein
MQMAPREAGYLVLQTSQTCLTWADLELLVTHILDGPLAGYGNALGIRPPGLSDKDWAKTKAQQQLMKESKMGAFAQRPDFSKYPETGFP